MSGTAVERGAASARIVWFDELTRDDVAIAGGKGANLGELARAGLPVPEGFVVTAPAYLEAMDVAGVREDLRERADRADVGDEQSLARAASELQELVRKAGVPDALRRDVLDAYHRLGAEAFRGGALVGDGGGLRDDVVRRHERDLHQRARRRRAPRARRRLLGVALRRARVRVPSDAGM